MSRAGWATRTRASATALVALTCLGGCGRTSEDEPSISTEACTPHPDIEQAAAAPVQTLPTVLEGELCNGADALWLAFEGPPFSDALGAVRAELMRGDGAEPYMVSVFGVDQGSLQPLSTNFATNKFTLDPSSPELVFAPTIKDFSTNTLVLGLEGPAGRVKLELTRPELPASVDCAARYEALPPQTPTVALPTVLEAELCSYRDSRTWAIDVAAERAVSITLLDPLSIDTFRLNVYRSDVDDYQPLPVSSGATEGELGLLAERRLTFTPQQAGTVHLYAGVGRSRGAPPRLRIEQQVD
jgi:hypothetical protein